MREKDTLPRDEKAEVRGLAEPRPGPARGGDTRLRDEDEIPAEPVPPPKRGVELRRMLLPAAAALGVVMALASAYFLGRLSAPGAETVEAVQTAPKRANAGKLKSASPKAEKAAKAGKAAKRAKAPKPAPLYLALEPAFVVNFLDNENLRFLQIEVQVMAFDQGELDVLTASGPVVRDALVTLFSDQAYEVVSTRQGKERLREQALAELRRIVRERTGKDGPEAVYFTSFVMQ